jgi:hypothetical protein
VEKYLFVIDSEMFLFLGIDPGEAVKYLENKRAKDIEPVHVIALLLLKQQAVPSS